MEAVVAFPDRIERTVEIAHPPATVWAALTTAEGLSAWFGQEAGIDLRPGGSAWMKWDGGHTADMRVERVEEPAVFGFTWQIDGLPDGDTRRTYVEFTLEPTGTGTRLTVVGLDCLDGTPLIDIKPYFASTDSFPDAVVGWHKARKS